MGDGGHEDQKNSQIREGPVGEEFVDSYRVRDHS